MGNRGQALKKRLTVGSTKNSIRQPYDVGGGWFCKNVAAFSDAKLNNKVLKIKLRKRRGMGILLICCGRTAPVHFLCV